MKHLRATIGALCVAGVAAHAGIYAEIDKATSALKSVSAAELPAQAAQFVLKATAKEQTDAAVGAMKAAIALNPSAAAAVLASIVKADPAAAPQVVAAAVAALPKQRFELAQIAAKNAPAFAAEIVAQLAKEDPQEAQLFADVVDKVVPGTSSKVNTSAALAASRVPQSGPVRALSGGGGPVIGAPFVPPVTPPTPIPSVQPVSGGQGYIGG